MYEKMNRGEGGRQRREVEGEDGSRKWKGGVRKNE